MGYELDKVAIEPVSPTVPQFYSGTFHFTSKVKVIPLQAWTGTEGSRRLSLPDFKTIGT